MSKNNFPIGKQQYDEHDEHYKSETTEPIYITTEFITVEFYYN